MLCWKIPAVRTVDINPGDTIRLKKVHPCGSYEWLVVRSGADVRLKCLKCGRHVLLEREVLIRRIKEIRQ